MKIVKTFSVALRREEKFSRLKKIQLEKISFEFGILAKNKVHPNVFKDKQRLVEVKKRLFRRRVNKDFVMDGSFQEAMAPVLVLAQVFALMPVRGVTLKTADNLSFSWTHFRTIYSLFVVLCFGAMTGVSIFWTTRLQFNYDVIETLVFYTSIFLTSACFFNLARKWPILMRQWEDTERTMPAITSQKDKGQLAYRIKSITFVVSMMSLMEHLLNMLSVIYYVNACPTFSNPIESYLHSNFIQVFTFVDFNIWLGVFGKIINILSTFAWSFVDTFLMVISVGISTRFYQLNEYMLIEVKKPTNERFWIQNRIRYRSLCRLCNTIDDAISMLTVICFANNLYFICGKIFKSIQKKPSYSHALYFWFSLGFLLCRTLALSLYSAQIHEETSKRPLTVFRSVSRKLWCNEIQRFAEEVATDIVAFSGMKFFHLTRSLLLSVAGTIVTYELVLLQFAKEDKQGTCGND